MAPQAKQVAPGSPNPVSARIRDLSSLRSGERGSAFRGIGRNGRSGRGGRGGGRLTSTSAHNVQAENPDHRPSPPDIAPLQIDTSSSGKTPIPTLSVQTSDNGSERGGRSRASSRRSSRAALKVAATSPTSETSPVTPPGISRSSNHRRRSHQQAKGFSDRSLKPPSSQSFLKPPKGGGGSIPSAPVTRKDIPPHLLAAHEAGIRHDIEALVERVRAVAMAENRPTTPGSHIDWAGDEDDSLPDLDDWGIPSIKAATDGEGISPILGDTLKPLPEPHSVVVRENQQEMDGYSVKPDEDCEEGLEMPPSLASVQAHAPNPPTSEDVCDPSTMEVIPKSSLLPPSPNSGTSSNVQTPANSFDAPKFLEQAAREDSIPKDGGLSESIHAPVSTEPVFPLPQSRSTDERGLTASIHAPAAVPEFCSAPNLLSGQSAPAKTRSHNRNHGRSHTESRPGPPSRSSRSDASSPLGKHIYRHSRNHSTPADGPGQRVHHTSRPVITGEAIGRLVKTIGGLGSGSRSQSIAVSTDSTVAS